MMTQVFHDYMRPSPEKGLLYQFECRYIVIFIVDARKLFDATIVLLMGRYMILFFSFLPTAALGLVQFYYYSFCIVLGSQTIFMLSHYPMETNYHVPHNKPTEFLQPIKT